MRGMVLACGQDAPPVTGPERQRTVSLPARPGKNDVDPLLRETDHLIVAGTDADLAAVVLRLLRKDRLADTMVGYIPAFASSAVATLWGLPTDVRDALAVATNAEVDPVPLIRDDSGGVLLGVGTIGPVQGVAYCDDEVALRGPARRLEVRPDDEGGPGLVARVTRGTVFKRHATFLGRAFELGCLPATPVLDGVPHARPIQRWTWYRHTEDLRLLRGLA